MAVVSRYLSSGVMLTLSLSPLIVWIMGSSAQQQKPASRLLDPHQLLPQQTTTQKAGKLRVRSGVLFKTLVNFDGRNGAEPYFGVIQGTDGNLYGTTRVGGSNNLGTVYRMTPRGYLLTLLSFNGTNGSLPGGALVQNATGLLYGTTSFGGNNNQGTIFRLGPQGGRFKTLVNFDVGADPFGGLLLAKDGNFYGTTTGGGGTNGAGTGAGTVYKLTPQGTLTTLHTFTTANPERGLSPTARLLQGKDGNFYGTTRLGGTSNQGTVFKITPAGMLTTLVRFQGTNGKNPYGGLVQGKDGNFYGTTGTGGTADKGTIFRLTPTGKITTLVNFTGSNGQAPAGALVQGKDGYFYGTTSGGGLNGGGTVFVVTATRAFATLVDFDGTNGSNPLYGALFQASDGNLYGTTAGGGKYGKGTVFRLTVDVETALPSK